MKSIKNAASIGGSISIVIPCFNEATIIQGTVQKVLVFLATHCPEYQIELIPVDDGSTDGTGAIMRQMSANDAQIKPIFFQSNRGRGAAIKAGIHASTGDRVILLDADLSYDVEHVGDILKEFERDPKLDVVVVSPYMRGGTVSGVPWKRLWLSKAANWLLAGFFSDGLSTVTCVVRGYRGTQIRALPLFEEGKELHLEILRKFALIGAKIVEIPGRLAWKDGKKRAKRQNNMRVVGSAKKHLLYGLLIKPTRMFKYVALVLLLVGLYEAAMVGVAFLHFYEGDVNFWHGVWKALSAAFQASPHTVAIASVSLILGFQAFTYLALFQVLTLQQEETLRHILAVLERQKNPEVIH